MSAPTKPGPATVAPQGKKPDRGDYNAAALYKAIAARAFHRFISFRSTVEYHGAELPEYGIALAEREAGERYERLVEEWIWEPVMTAAHAMALIQFASCIAAISSWPGSQMRAVRSVRRRTPCTSWSRLVPAAWITPYANAEGMTRLRQEEAERAGDSA